MPSDDSHAAPPGLHLLPRRKKAMTFAGVLLAMFLGSLDQTIIGTAMPRIIADLGGFSHYTWISSAYIIASAVIMPITGSLTDRYGRKPFYMIGLSLFLATSIACGLSRTMWQLIVSRAAKGLGAGIMMATGFAVIGDLFPPAERGKYIGTGSAVYGLSSIIGPTLGGYITDTLSWNWVFFINIPLCFTIITLFALYFPDVRPKRETHRIDWAGMTTLALAIVPAMLALTWWSDHSWRSVRILGMFGFSAAMLVCFLWIESRSKAPIVPLAMFRNRIVAVSLIVTFLIGFGMFGSIIFIPLFFQGVLGVTATISGSFLTPMMLGMVFGSFFSGQSLSRMGGHYKIQGMLGLGLMAAGLAILTGLDMNTGYARAVMYISVVGIGLGATLPIYTIAVQNAVSLIDRFYPLPRRRHRACRVGRGDERSLDRRFP
jgi:EmrB/QacA subfamily drug resistance transporter